MVSHESFLNLVKENKATVEELKLIIQEEGKKWAGIRHRFTHDNTILHYACYYDEATASNFVKILIENGADINACNEFLQTPLMMFLEKRGSFEAVKILLEAGAKVNYRDKQGNLALHYARLYNAAMVSSLIKLLVKYGANILAHNKLQQTSLMLFLDAGIDCKIIKVLLEAGANVEAKDDKGNTALHYIFNYNDGQQLNNVVRLIKAKGGKISATNNDGLTPFMYYFKSKNVHRTNIVKVLLEAGCDVNNTDNKGNNVLHYISNYEPNKVKWDTLKLLLDNGANLNFRNENNDTPFIKFLENSHNKETVKILLEAGAGVNCEEMLRDNLTAIDYCLVTFLQRPDLIDDTELLKLVIHNGANVNMHYKDVPLINYCLLCNIDDKTIETLLTYGASTCHMSETLVTFSKVFLRCETNRTDRKPLLLQLFKYIILEDGTSDLFDLEDYKETVNEYKSEALKLKNCYIKKGVSLYDFCKETDIRTLAAQFSGVYLNMKKLQHRYTHYFHIIQSKITIVLMWRDAWYEIEDNIRLSNKPGKGQKEVTLDPSSLKRVASYLNYKEMLILIRVTC